MKKVFLFTDGACLGNPGPGGWAALLERAAEAYLKALPCSERDRRDIAIINKNAERLNREAADVLDYQKSW